MRAERRLLLIERLAGGQGQKRGKQDDAGVSKLHNVKSVLLSNNRRQYPYLPPNVAFSSNSLADRTAKCPRPGPSGSIHDRAIAEAAAPGHHR